jgi:hypothetical protein
MTPVKDDNRKVPSNLNKLIATKKGKIAPVGGATAPVYKDISELDAENSTGITGVFSFKAPMEGEDQDKHNDDGPTVSACRA